MSVARRPAHPLAHNLGEPVHLRGDPGSQGGTKTVQAEARVEESPAIHRTPRRTPGA